MNPQHIADIKDNLFPGAHAAIENWQSFPWHTIRKQIAACQVNSSQALAIDVFGTLLGHPGRDAVLNRLAQAMSLPGTGHWTIQLEWTSALNPLHEKRKTQVDAVAESADALIMFECKFTEREGGCCSQPNRLQKGAYRGQSQCNKNYEDQINLRYGILNRCALSGKGIGYWQMIPQLFNYDASVDYQPCPFAGPEFQWMRNITAAYAEAQLCRKKGAFCLVYADAPGLGVADMVHSEKWDTFLAQVHHDKLPVQAVSYQDLLRLAQDVDPSDGWELLAQWVERKVQAVQVR